LIIGSITHAKADKCINWGELVYVGDYDLIIVNTSSLTKEVIERILDDDPNYFGKLRKDIADVQQRRGIAINVILSRYEFVTNPGSQDAFRDSLLNTINNYSWSPVIPELERIPTGKKLNREKSSVPQDYLNEIKGYDLLYDGAVNNTGYVDKSKDGNIYTKLHYQALLKNNVGRDIAFAINWKVHQYSDYTTILDGHLPISFFPPTDNISEGIDILIRDYCQEPAVGAPEWIKDLQLPGEEGIIKVIDSKTKTIESVKKEIIELESKLSSLDVYKKLLYTQGFELEDIVEDVLSQLGINLKKPDVTNIEDRFFDTKDKKKIYVEIRGVNRLMNEGDLAQLIKRIAEKPTSKEYLTRGVFIFNHQNKVVPQKRETAFHHNIEVQAKTFNICLIDTLTLFKLIKQKLAGNELKDFDKQLFNTSGIYKLSPDKQPS